MADKKKIKKQDKEDKYKKLLESIDLKLGNEKIDEKQRKLEDILDSSKQHQSQQKSDEVFTISSLLSKIQGNDEQENAGNLKKQLEDLDKKSKLLHEPESFVKQERAERKVNYKIISDDVSKWIPIIKRAREADHLDFTDKTQDDMRVNAISGNELKRNKIAMNIESKLQELNLKTEKQIRAKEIELLEKVDPKEAKKRINEIHKQKMLLFQQEIKNKRVSKIKSKLYHKIKKRQKQRADQKEYENMGEDMKLQEQEKIMEERAQERIGMRHKTKSKHVSQMLKYGDKKTYQQSLNDINHQRQALLKKVQDMENDINSDDMDYENLDDKEAREQFIEDLQKELKDGDKEVEQEELTGVKFIDDLHNKKKNESRDEARKLLSKLQETEGLDSDILSEDDLIESDDEEGQKKKADNINNKRKAQKEALEKEEEFTGRKIYKKSEPEDKKSELEIEIEEMQKSKKKKKMNALDIVKTHIQDQKEKIQEEEEEEEEKHRNNKNGNDKKKETKLQEELSSTSNIQTKLIEATKKASAVTINEDALTEGLNVNKLKEKFKKNAEVEFSKKELEAFNIENKEEIYKDLSNFNVLVDDDNEERFLAEKFEDYEKELPQDKKALHGWGSWTGQGIAEKSLPTAEELAKQKAAKINLLKKQRADGTMDNVIINEKRTKLFTQHLVKELPHPYKNKEQFEYLNNAPLGSEWSTMRSHVNMVKPKIKTKAGYIIQPSTAPKSFQQS